MSRLCVMGVDPGSVVTGYGLVTMEGSRLVHVASGAIRTREEDPFSSRLATIYAGLTEVISRHSPTSAAVEIIPHARNTISALKLGQARGVVLLALVHKGLEVAEYNPLSIKKAVVGYGRAEKEQVQAMVERLLGITLDGPKDVSDALAIAICHLHTSASLRRLGGR